VYNLGYRGLSEKEKFEVHKTVLSSSCMVAKLGALSKKGVKTAAV
jgi:hypothetical protein